MCINRLQNYETAGQPLSSNVGSDSLFFIVRTNRLIKSVDRNGSRCEESVRIVIATYIRHSRSRHRIRDIWRRIVFLCLASVLSAWLGTGNLHIVRAEESSQGSQKNDSSPPNPQGPNTSATNEPASEPKPEGPRQEPRFLPPVLRPKLTPEELEEAERLRKLAAKYGTDPTAIVGRVQLSNQYVNLPQGAQLNTTIARVDVPFRENWLFRVDTPVHTWLDPNRPGLSSAQGVGDLTAILGWRAYNTPEYAFFIGAASTYPTASDNLLGTGKYTAGPIMATGRFLPRWESFLFGVFQHLVSVGGDPSRADISLTQANLQINTIWAEHWWTIVQGTWRVNWEQKTKSSMTAELELGRNVIGRWGVYVRPGVGIWGTNVPGTYDWNIEVGTRYMFKSF